MICTVYYTQSIYALFRMDKYREMSASNSAYFGLGFILCRQQVETLFDGITCDLFVGIQWPNRSTGTKLRTKIFFFWVTFICDAPSLDYCISNYEKIKHVLISCILMTRKILYLTMQKFI